MELNISKIFSQIETETLVSNTIKKHLQIKQQELMQLAKERDAQKDKETTELEKQKEEITEQTNHTLQDYENIKHQIQLDDEYRVNLLIMENVKQKEEDDKLR